MLGNFELARISAEILLKEDRPRGRFSSIPYYAGGIPDLSGFNRDFDGYVPIKGSINPQTGKEKRFRLIQHKWETSKAKHKKAYYYYAIILNDNPNKKDRTVVFAKAPVTYGEFYRQQKVKEYLSDSYHYDGQIVKEIKVPSRLIDEIKWRDCKLIDFKKIATARYAKKPGISKETSDKLIASAKKLEEAPPRNTAFKADWMKGELGF